MIRELCIFVYNVTKKRRDEAEEAITDDGSKSGGGTTPTGELEGRFA